MLLLNYCLEGLGVESRFGLFLLKLFSTVSVLLIFLFVERKFFVRIYNRLLLNILQVISQKYGRNL